MKKLRVIFNIVFALLLAIQLCACTSIGSACNKQSAPLPPGGKKLKVGYFVGQGSRSNGVYFWAQLLFYSPQLEVTLLEAQDIRDGKLKELDLLLIPGGSSELQVKDLQDSGKAAIQEFVRNGGSYIGICAGFHCTLNRKERLELMPFEYCRGAGGAQAVLPVEISKRGAEIMNIRPGRYNVRYSLGPISKPGKDWEHGKGEILGVYKGTVSPKGRPGGNFFNAPAVIYGNYGKGKIIATSFHPESHITNHDLAMGCFYAVEGFKPTPQFPKKNFHPLRVAFYTASTLGKEPVKRMLELNSRPEIDVVLVTSGEFSEGMLNHVDALVIPDAIDEKNISLAKNWDVIINPFLDRGGKLFVSGAEAKAFGKHQNITEIPAGESFVPAVLDLK